MQHTVDGVDHHLRNHGHTVAARPQRELMPGQDQEVVESVRRRREQYRVYQQRRRARQRATLVRLEREVRALIHSIATLQHRNLHLFSSRGTDDGAPASLVATFFRVFEHGLVPSQSASQENFMRSMMASDVQGPDYQGVDALVEQWWLYETYFTWLSCVPKRMAVLALNESTVVTVDVLMAMQPSQSAIEFLFPDISQDEVAVQQLLSSRLDVHGSVRFEFNAAGVVTWCGADMDFISSLQPVLGSLERVNACVQQSRISLITGRISTEAETSQRAEQHDDADGRYDIEFLLI